MTETISFCNHGLETSIQFVKKSFIHKIHLQLQTDESDDRPLATDFTITADLINTFEM